MPKKQPRPLLAGAFYRYLVKKEMRKHQCVIPFLVIEFEPKRPYLALCALVPNS
jgi:hypothetical protein